MDSRPLCFRLETEIKEQLRAIPDWQQKLRDALPDLISQWTELGETSDAADLD
ncbi:MAG: hypothetical protein DSM106950_04060 [Stigonema ocellatum SAG 48.90 = DSM 106950]|nr:hypothetical protein [Stigonema ocellatum SAG 48.90 = DSM 106950]